MIILVHEGKTDNPIFNKLAVSTTIEQRMSGIRESILGWESLKELVKRLKLDRDLNSRAGKIEGITAKGLIQVIDASVPLSKMFGYSTSLRSITQGRATYSMQFSHYDKV